MNNDIKLTTIYRDKMNVEKMRLLNNYAKQTIHNGTMYYIYSQNSENNEIYNLYICEEGKNSEIISIPQAELPNGATIGSVLREQNRTYILDEEATETISKQLTQILEQLLQEQKLELDRHRIEGHNYEFVEWLGDTICLTDITINDGECFEETDFSIEQAEEGMIFRYVNGEYRSKMQL